MLTMPTYQRQSNQSNELKMLTIIIDDSYYSFDVLTVVIFLPKCTKQNKINIPFVMIPSGRNLQGRGGEGFECVTVVWIRQLGKHYNRACAISYDFALTVWVGSSALHCLCSCFFFTDITDAFTITAKGTTNKHYTLDYAYLLYIYLHT